MLPTNPIRYWTTRIWRLSSHLGCLCIGAGRECLRLPSLSLSLPRPQVRCEPSGICTNPPFACLIGFGEGVGAWIRVGLDSLLSTDELSLKALLQNQNRLYTNPSIACVTGHAGMTSVLRPARCSRPIAGSISTAELFARLSIRTAIISRPDRVLLFFHTYMKGHYLESTLSTRS